MSVDRDDQKPQVENQFHHYRGNEIPWYVRLIWIGFWAFAVFYTIAFLIPALQRELSAVGS